MGEASKRLRRVGILLIALVVVFGLHRMERRSAAERPAPAGGPVAIETPKSNVPFQQPAVALGAESKSEDNMPTFSARFRAGILWDVDVGFNQAPQGLHGTAEEREAVGAAAIRAVQRLHAVQADLASYAAWNPESGSAEIVVPAFAQAGAKIKEDLVAELEAVLGSRWEAFTGELGLLDHTIFQDFGAYDQVFHLRVVPGESDMLIVAREVVMAVHRAAGPGSTDRVLQVGKSTESLVPLDALIDGEYQFLNEPFQQVVGKLLPSVSGPGSVSAGDGG